MVKTNRFPSRIASLLVCQGILLGSAAAAWEPTRPIESVIPAGTCGSADQMRASSPKSLKPIAFTPSADPRCNKAGGAGAEDFLYVKEE